MTLIGLVGSPKMKHSASERLLAMLKEKVVIPWSTPTLILNHLPLEAATLTTLADADTWVLSFPLYVDGIPGHLLKHLEVLEKTCNDTPRKRIIYVLINAGFFEGEHTHVALDCIKHWCTRSNATYGGGLGIGAGAMLAFATIPIFKDPRRNLNQALDRLAVAISEQRPFDNQVVSPNMPRFLYSWMGNRMWFNALKRNGLSRKNMTDKPGTSAPAADVR